MFDDCSDVRIALPEDGPEILRLMKLAHEECGEHSMNEEKVCQAIWAAVHRQGSMIGVIGGRGEGLKGYIYLCLNQVWYSTETQLLEMSNFVDPEHRRSNYAKQLIAFAKKCSDDIGIDLTIGVISNSRTSAKCRLYQRQLPKVGEYFIHRPAGRA